MTPEENVRVARRWVELFNARDDVEEFVSLHDPEVELQTPGGPRLHGLSELRAWFEKEYENVRTRLIPERFVAGSDTVVGIGRTEIEWIDSGEVAREFESAGVYWFRGDKITRWQPFGSHGEALEAAGVRE